jgi:mycothiol synthase
MIARPWEPYQLVPPSATADNRAAIEDVWAASQDIDELLGRPRDGWWSITNWASANNVLLHNGEIIGVAAIEYHAGAEAAEARVALLPTHRKRPLAEKLIRATVKLARDEGAPLVRLYAPTGATWATAPIRTYQFRAVRTQHLMLRITSAADAVPLALPVAPGVMIRSLQDGEEGALLAALNRAWAETWNFRPLTLEALLDDVHHQRDGMLLAVDEANQDHILATIHAQFDPTRTNPDGPPYAWISNLTTDPAARGRGLGRLMLMAGMRYLQAKGARSIALGVDGGAIIPLNLYRSFGFQTISTVDIWERATQL